MNKSAVTQREPSRRRLHGRYRAIKCRVGHACLSLTGKQRGDVSIFTHPQKNHVKDRLTLAFLRRSPCFNILQGIAERKGLIFLTAQTMYLRIGNLQGREQQLFGDGVVAFRVRRRHATLVRPEKMDRRRSWFPSILRAPCLAISEKKFRAKCGRRTTRRNTLDPPGMFLV